MSKSQLGQFYTTNYEYILQNCVVPIDTSCVVEPFVGNGDLLNFLGEDTSGLGPGLGPGLGLEIEKYDIDPKTEDTIKRDTLLEPPDYNGKFVLTNPPYLARNKSQNKEIYDKYNTNDLYKCFIISIINSKCVGGIMIIPLNFISSIRKADVDLRRSFLELFTIDVLNIFEEQVFNDTSYAVCTIQFTRTTESPGEQSPINTYIYPSGNHYIFKLTADNNYTIGGEIYNLTSSSGIKVERATHINEKSEFLTNILLKCIDDNINSQLGFKLVADEERYIDKTAKLSARSYATLIIHRKLTLSQQGKLVKKMNSFIKTKREEYNSLFLTNYRESNSIARKRISFDLAFKICGYMVDTIIND